MHMQVGHRDVHEWSTKEMIAQVGKRVNECKMAEETTLNGPFRRRLIRKRCRIGHASGLRRQP